MLSNNITCNYCQKVIEVNKLNLFNNKIKKLNFCSQDCQEKWNSEAENWTNIHEKFGKKDYGKTWWQKWKEVSFTTRDAQQLINAEFAPNDLDDVIKWKDLNLTASEIQEWISIGLDKKSYELAYYCKSKKLTPTIVKDNLNTNYRTELAEKLVGELGSAQVYVDFFYFPQQRNEIIKLDINHKNLTGELALEGFSNLTTFSCFNNQLTKLDLTGCPNLTTLHCENNKLTKLDFLKQCNSDKLKSLNIRSNGFSESDLTILSEFINLEELYIGSNDKQIIDEGYNRFVGSLAPLKLLTKLKYLDISNTDIDSGLEYLPNTLEYFFCSNKVRPTALVKNLAQELKSGGDKPKDHCGNDNYAYLLTIWKQVNPELVKNFKEESWIKLGFSKEEIKEWTNIGLKVNEWEFANYLKQKGYTVTNAKDEKYAQNYLDFHYPQTERENITKLDISYKKITGILDLTTFPQLEELLCNNNCLTNLIINENSSIKEIGLSYNNFTTLTITNQPLLAFLECSWNSELTNLIVNNNSLVRIHCQGCALFNLELTNNPKLSILRCIDNKLTNLNFLTQLNHESLTSLIISNNKLTGELISYQEILSKFTKLKILLLDNNPFTGSLIFLTNLTKLKILNITNTQIDSGLEYLPESLESISCSGELAEKLKDYKKDDSSYDYKKLPRFKISFTRT